MSRNLCIRMPQRVASKIQRVLGIPPAMLDGYDPVLLVEELCDTALMLDQEQAAIDPAGDHLPASGPCTRRRVG